MGIEKLQQAVTDLEQRMELLEEVLALVVYRNEDRFWDGPDLEHKEGDQ